MQTFKNVETGNVVEAAQLTWANRDELAKLCGGLATEEIDPEISDMKYPAINVPTPDGNRRLQQGFYLVRSHDMWFVARPPNFERVHEVMLQSNSQTP